MLLVFWHQQRLVQSMTCTDEWCCTQDIKEATVTPEPKFCALFDVGQQQRVFRRQTAAVVKRRRRGRGRRASDKSRSHVVQLVVQRLQSAVSRAGHLQRSV